MSVYLLGTQQHLALNQPDFVVQQNFS